MVLRSLRRPSFQQGIAVMTTTHAATGLRILVVDDDRDTTESTALLLSLSGHEAHCAYDGPSALAEARTWHPDVVLLDLQMPGMDGLEVARRLRQDPALEHVFIACISGHGYPVHRDRSLEAGCDEHFIKPIDPKTLQTLLERLAELEKHIHAVRDQAGMLRANVREGYRLICQSKALLEKSAKSVPPSE
jgi:CheY-like chemotaxis protein